MIAVKQPAIFSKLIKLQMPAWWQKIDIFQLFPDSIKFLYLVLKLNHSMQQKQGGHFL